MHTDYGESQLQNFINDYNTHKKEILQQKSELTRLCQEIVLKPADAAARQVDLQKAFKALDLTSQKFEKDIGKWKEYSKIETAALKIQSLLKGQDILQILDENRGIQTETKLCLDRARSFLAPEIPATAASEARTTESVYQLFDKFWIDHRQVSANDFIKKAEEIRRISPSLAHRCYEKAAEIHSLSGNFRAAFELRKQAAESLGLPSSHPLSNLDQAIDERISSKKTPSNFGAHFSGLDAGPLKRGHMTFRKRTVDHENKVQSTLHINTYARDKLNKTIDAIKQNPALVSESLPSNIKSKISIKEVDLVTVQEIDNGYQGEDEKGNFSHKLSEIRKAGKGLEIRFEGIGIVQIGSDPKYPSMERRIFIEIAAGQKDDKAIHQIHSMLAMLGLGPLLQESLPEDLERQKIAFLFRNSFPQQAWEMERSPSYYEIPIASLKNQIIKKIPGMEAVFEKYLKEPSPLVLEEIFPGKKVWSLSDLSRQLREAGAVGLMIGFEGTVETLAKVILNGPASSQERFEAGLAIRGTSPMQDHQHGGGGSVFARMITKLMLEAKREKIDETGTADPKAPKVMESACVVDRFPGHGEIQLLYDLDVLNRGGYAYSHDRYGSKSPQHYAKRDNLVDFTKKLEANNVDNEVMMLGFVPPQFLKHILVRSQFRKDNLIQELENAKLIETIGDIKYLKGYNKLPLDQLIITGKAFTPEMWS